MLKFSFLEQLNIILTFHLDMHSGNLCHFTQSYIRNVFVFFKRLAKSAVKIKKPEKILNTNIRNILAGKFSSRKITYDLK